MKEKIRRELKNGKTIERVCTEYQISFSELVKLMKGDQYLSGKRSKYGLYIYRNNRGLFVVNKNKVYYGMYKSLEDAVKVKNFFLYHGWNKRRLDEVCEKLGVERC